NGNPTRISRAKRILFTAVGGFIIVCAAWLIVNTIIVGIAKGSFYSGGQWFVLNCSSNDRPRNANVSELFTPNSQFNPTVTGGGTGGGGGGGSPSNIANDQALAQLNSSCAGVTGSCFT